MAVKRFFGADGVLVEVEVPDRPLPVVATNLKADHSAHKLFNPTHVDPDTLVVDAAALPDLKPTAGAQAATKFPDPLPGSGEGAGVGQKSGATLRDAWVNDPHKDPGTVQSVQSGPVGSRAAVAPSGDTSDTDRKVGGSTPSPNPVDGEEPDDTWTKAQLAAFLGDDAPADSEKKDVFLAKAKETYALRKLA